MKATYPKNKIHPYLVFDLYLRDKTQNQANIDQIYLDAGSSMFAEIQDAGLAESSRVGFIAYNTNTVDLNDSGARARACVGGANDIAAIWEPNYLKHTSYVQENDKRVTSTSQEIPSYGLRTSAVGTTIQDVTDTSSANYVTVRTNKIRQNDQTHETLERSLLTCTDGSTIFGIKPNQITKIRVYIWMEGQDPDCIDLASRGKVLSAKIKFTKDIVNVP